MPVLAKVDIALPMRQLGRTTTLVRSEQGNDAAALADTSLFSCPLYLVSVSVSAHDISLSDCQPVCLLPFVIMTERVL